MSTQSNLKNEDLTKSSEFELIYSGPSFEAGIKIKALIDNLKSIRELIYNIADVNSEYKKGYNKASDIKEIKIIPANGSIIERISVLFSNPEVRSAVLTVLTGLFFYLLARRDNRNTEGRINAGLEEIEDLVLRDQLKNVKKLYEPLEQNKDKLEIAENNSVKIEINFLQKEDINQSIHEIEKEIKTEEVKEEYEGYISAIDLDTKRLKFHPKDMKEAYPLEFNLPVAIVASILGKPIKAKMNVRKYKDKIRKFGLIEYKIIQKDLRGFVK